MSLLLVLPLVPTEALGNVAAYDAARVLQGVTLLGATCLVLRGRATTYWNQGFTALLLCLGLMSCAKAAVPSAALREGVWTTAWLLSVASLSGLLKHPLIRGRVLVAVVVGQFAYALLASALLLYGLLVEQLFAPWQVFPGYENPRYFNHLQTLCVPLLLACSSWPQAPRTVRRLAAAAAALHVFLICVFLARATVVGIVVATLVVSVVLRERRLARALMLYATAGVLLYLVGCKLLPHLLGMAEMPTFRELNERGSIAARLYLWQIALQDIREHPWLGVGPMHFAHQLNGEAAHPHNIYLQIGAEYGLPFALTALVGLALWMRRRFQLFRIQADSEQALLQIACLTAITGALIDGLFSGNFVMPMSQSWAALCMGLLLALEAPAAAAFTTARPSWMPRAVGLVVVAMLAANLAVLRSELTQSEAHMGDGPSLRPGYTNPRFWLDGWF